MRKYTIPQSMTVEYLLGDHLDSTSITTDNTGAKVSEMRYCEASRRDKPCPLRFTSRVLREGEIRSWWTAGLSTTPPYELSNYTFTGQYSHMDDPSTAAVTEGFGLMFYNARWYDPALGRFAQADSIVPGGVQGLDRYAYANNNPLYYTDPSGHSYCDSEYAFQEDCQDDSQDSIVSNNEPELSYGGTLMKGLFEGFKEVYPDATIYDFTIWIFSGEFSGLEGDALSENPNLAETLAHTASHWLYINHGQMSENTLLNWLWAMDSGKLRWSTWHDTGEISDYGTAVELATEVVGLMRDAPEEWRRWETWEENTYWNGKWNPVNLPPHGYSWGNASLFPSLKTSEIERIGKPIFKWPPDGVDRSTFYIFSLWYAQQLCPYNPYISGC